MSKAKLLNTIYRWRVRFGLLSILLVVILGRPNGWSILAGLGVFLPGLLLRTWACGNLIKEKKLAVSGPYRYTRNPLYLGNLMLGIGVVIAARSWWILVVFAINFLVFYPIIILREKNRMIKFFPEEYYQFKEKVPLFFPTLKPKLPPQKKSFQWNLYKKNKEHRALIGSLIFWAAMVFKAVFSLYL